MQFHGDYFAVNKSQKHDASLIVTPENCIQIKVTKGQVLQSVKINDIEISPRLGHTPRIITFPDGSSFETSENDQIDVWLKKHQSLHSLAWLHKLESRLIYVFIALLLVSAFSWGFIKYAVPGIATSVAQILPNEVNQYLGSGTLELLDKSYFGTSQLPIARQTELIQQFKSYTKHYQNLSINIVFRHGGNVGANAFALPDGHIVFTDEMVEIAENDQELIAILGHEIGHLEHRHLLRRVIQNSMLASLIILISGDISYASSIVLAIPAMLLELVYSRQFEQEADLFALNFLQKNAIAPHYFADIMMRLSQYTQNENTTHTSDKKILEPISEYLSSHPVTEERIQPFLLEN